MTDGPNGAIATVDSPPLSSEVVEQEQMSKTAENASTSLPSGVGKEKWEILKQKTKMGMCFSIPTNKQAQNHAAETHGVDSWRCKVVHFLHSPLVQHTLMVLLMVDVLLLFIELFLLATFPHCTLIERDGIACCPVTNVSSEAVAEEEALGSSHRFLLEDELEHSVCAHGLAEFAEASCDEHKWHVVHGVETGIFALTIFILSLFFLELNGMMIALGPNCFFRQFFYLVDYIVVTISLVLEVLFYAKSDDIYQSFVGMLVLVRIWRFVRIGHGIIEVTHELAKQEYDELEAYKGKLEQILRDHGLPFPEFKKNGLHHDDPDTVLVEKTPIQST